jgi:hypothetical protein
VTVGGARRMRAAGLVLAAAALGGAALSGCGGGCPAPTLRATWTISDSSGAPLTCAAAGASTVQFIANGASYQAQCGPGSALIPLPSAGTYNIQANLLDSGGAVIAQLSPISLAIHSCGTTTLPAADFVLPACGPGAVHASWTITANGSPISCAQAGAAEVDITVDSTMVAPFTCTALSGTTPAIDGGITHNISLSLLDSSGNVLSQTQTMSLPVRCDTTEDIGNVELSLTP